MNTTITYSITRKLPMVAIASAILLLAEPASAWRGGPWGPAPLAWDPHEAYLDEYGFFDRYGPRRGDIRRMQRDNWHRMRGYPVYPGIGRHGPTLSDIRRQHQRKLRRAWGYPY